MSDWSSDVCSSDLGHQRRCSFQVYGWHRVRVLLARRRMSARAAWRNRVALEAICAMAFAPSADGIDCAPYLDERGSNPAWTVRTNMRSEEHTSELQSLMRISYAVFCLKKKKQKI